MVTKEQVESKRKSFRDSRYPEIQTSLAGLQLTYFIMPQSENPQLPDFAYVFTDGQEAVIGVSESVPTAFRDYWAYHELVEYTKEPNTPGRCKRALQRELAIVPEAIRQEYIQRRRNFFVGLIKYGKAEKFAEADIREFEGSLGELEQLL